VEPRANSEPDPRNNMSRSAGAPQAAQSLEELLNEEHSELLASLPRERGSDSPRRRFDTGHPFPLRNLDTEMPTSRHASMSGVSPGPGLRSPRKPKEKPSALDPSDPSTWTRSHTSKPNSPTLTRAIPTRTRHESDAGEQEYVGRSRDEMTHRAMSDSGPSMHHNSPRKGSGAMAAALSGQLENLVAGVSEGPQERHLQKAAAHSRSPSGRVVDAPSPDTQGALSPSLPDMGNRSSGSFSTAALSDSERNAMRQRSDEQAVDESSDEAHSISSEDETRGRDREAKGKQPSRDITSLSPDTEQPTSPEPSISVTSPEGESTTTPISPSVTTQAASLPPTTPNPTSAQDLRRASVSTIGSVGDGDDNDIEKAKKLGLSISPLDTKVPGRHVRMILRGDWLSFHKAAEAGERSVRTYLACSDLSVEANYALEWTIGTILRDGDTLLCVYSIEDETAETGFNSSNVSEAEKEQLHQEGAQAGKDAMDIMEGLTRQTTKGENQPMSKFIPATEAKSLSGSVDARNVSKKEMERLKAIDEITQTFLKLVRKTSLQVRCMIEVIHCKSPKHLILGAVSYLVLISW
jgi:hypothetical protein